MGVLHVRGYISHPVRRLSESQVGLMRERLTPVAKSLIAPLPP
ncbi:hypothetical protein [Exiguobacterium sp. SH5S4]|nr:hypothetical protein [Exiguobacterium sp. SH5S4]